jgi:hypothetical protein
MNYNQSKIILMSYECVLLYYQVDHFEYLINVIVLQNKSQLHSVSFIS